MADTAQRFRSRANDCAELAQNARDPLDKRMLIEIADELHAEADKIDGERGTDQGCSSARSEPPL
jgi:hypothetical protein